MTHAAKQQEQNMSQRETLPVELSNFCMNGIGYIELVFVVIIEYNCIQLGVQK